ncbi:GPI transamidase component PIG-T [Cimex lectularius]|uniref:GPI transamidase component PIG-T n=1 Tax=Cimex lectularius TaxID=79782 RepID=A0A8I6RR99_CIMLE|nr:GPI transamidase component PIG-T [Cimex lectularius]
MNPIAKCVLLSALLSLAKCRQAKDEYHEELFIKPLNGYVYAYFQFTTVWETPINNHTFDHCHLFPRPVGEILQRHDVQELHVSLTKGLWRYETWGYPVVSAPPGAELWTWFKPNTSDIDTKWKELTGALSGLLCSSINFIDGQNTMSPELSLRPLGISPTKGEPILKYSSLPREIVCTENLTPWKKLLPCNLKRGLSAILNSDHIYNTIYHSLGIHFRPICMDKECKRTGLELVQSVSLVYDLIIVRHAFPQWSIQKLFGQGLVKTCALSKSSMIYIDITSNKTDNPFILKPKNYKIIESTRGAYTTTLAVFNMEELNSLILYNIEVTYINAKKMYPVNIPPVVYANRYITGYGQEFGGVTTKIHNRHFQPVQILFLENIPWFVPVYFHSLKIESGGKQIQPIMKKYFPGKERSRPYYMELLVELPPRSVTFISIKFDYAFLRWQEYPPDANHGFYMGSAMITAMLPIAKNYTSPPRDKSLFADGFNASRPNYPIRVTTEVLIISLPTPDFSMPYNVICLACTVVALAFGPLHNITTKNFVFVKSTVKKGLIRILLYTIFDKVGEITDCLYKKYQARRATKVEETLQEKGGTPVDRQSDNESEHERKECEQSEEKNAEGVS